MNCPDCRDKGIIALDLGHGSRFGVDVVCPCIINKVTLMRVEIDALRVALYDALHAQKDVADQVKRSK